MVQQEHPSERERKGGIRVKLTKLEQAMLAVLALTLTAMIFYYLGGRSVASPVVITASQPSPSASVSVEPEKDGEQEKAEETSAPEEEVRFPIDLNTATVDELMALPSIGEVRARAIVEYRETNGPFRYVEDLRNVKGIGEGILAQVMDYVIVNEGDTNG